MRGPKGLEECVALVDAGAMMTVVDEGLTESIGATYTERRSLTSATGHKLEGEVGVAREMTVEDEASGYEKVLVVKLGGEVLRKLNVSEPIILGITTIELAGFTPDASTGRLRRVEAFII